MSDSGGTSVISTVIGDTGSTQWQIIIAMLASSVGFVVAIVNSIAAYFRDRKHMEELAAQERRFEAFKKELEDKQRRLVRFENVQELMKQYKKPLLQSAFDLQARFSNQIKTNFLYQFANKGNNRDRDYARLNMAFVISEFLGWLEVIRQEIVFIVGGGNRTSDLNLIIDAIKFQFTGETPIQGNARAHEPGYDEHWQVMQLYAGELRAIGEVMITERTYDDDNMASNLSVIGYAEFVRRLSTEVPDPGATEELAAWKSSKEKLHADILSPLLSYIDRLMGLDNDSTPKQRMAILQVLLCKLIDVLDDAVPYELGPEYNMEDGEEPRYIPRDFRLTPLVKWLSMPQLKWMSEQRFMVKVDQVDRSAWEDWYNRICELPKDEQDIYFRVAFPGFREDLAKDRDGRKITQADREKRLAKDGFPGAFPPKQLRVREAWWWAALSPEDHRRWYSEAAAKGQVPPGAHLHKSGSGRKESQQAKAHWSFAVVRHRKNSATAVSPEQPGAANSAYGGYSQPAILTAPSANPLRSGGALSQANSRADLLPTSEARVVTPVQPAVQPAANPRSSAGL